MPRSKWTFHPALEKYSHFKTLWNEVNGRYCNHVLLDAEFVEPLLHAYGDKNTLLAVQDDSEFPALTLLVRQNRFFWQTFQPQNAPIGLMLIKENDDLIRTIDSLIRSLPGITLGLGITNQDSDFTAFRNVNAYHDKIEIMEHIKTPRIVLCGNFDEYWKSRHKDLVQNLARRERKIKESNGEISLVEHRDPEEMAFAIQEYSRLEQSGWKGKQGTAVTGDNVQGVFYREVMERFGRRGEGVVFRFLLDGKTIASQIGLERDGMIVFLKTAYDETLKDLSPGLMMRKEIVRKLFSGGKIRTIELYGRVHDWHRKWTDQIRTIFHVNFYSGRLVKMGHRYYRLLGKRPPARD